MNPSSLDGSGVCRKWRIAEGKPDACEHDALPTTVCIVRRQAVAHGMAGPVCGLLVEPCLFGPVPHQSSVRPGRHVA